MSGLIPMRIVELAETSMMQLPTYTTSIGRQRRRPETAPPRIQAAGHLVDCPDKKSSLNDIVRRTLVLPEDVHSQRRAAAKITIHSATLGV